MPFIGARLGLGFDVIPFLRLRSFWLHAIPSAFGTIARDCMPCSAA
jgi:hypothetical protein